MDKHPREPIKHTCPDIDKYIKSIKWVMVRERDLQNMNEKDLFDAARQMNNELEECINCLEGLRMSNDTLRKWGIEEAEEVDRLEETISLTVNWKP